MDPGTATVRQVSDHAGLIVLGRLLLAAIGVGGVVGAVFELVRALLWDRDADPNLAVFGAFVALVVQLLSAVVLRLWRRWRPATDLAGLRVVLLPVPTLLAAVIAFGLWAPAPDQHSVLTCAGVGLLTAAGAWAAAPWCLMPLRPRSLGS